MSLTKFVAVWSILRAVLLGNKQTNRMLQSGKQQKVELEMFEM